MADQSLEFLQRRPQALRRGGASRRRVAQAVMKIAVRIREDGLVQYQPVARQ